MNKNGKQIAIRFTDPTDLDSLRLLQLDFKKHDRLDLSLAELVRYLVRFGLEAEQVKARIERAKNQT